MYKKSVLSILLFILFIILWIDAADAAFQVRVIHFVPNGEVVEQGFNANVERLVKQAQTFFANEMERHEHGRKTFRLETDAANAVVVHRIHGRHNRAHYQDWSNIAPELPPQFVNQNNIQLVLLQGHHLLQNAFCGLGWDWINGFNFFSGNALIPLDGNCLTWSIIAHELGHAFGLRHNYKDNNYLMGWGNTLLAPCEAEWLDRHHYFNQQQDLNSSPRIGLVHKPQELLEDDIRIRVNVEDTNELHLAYFYIPANIEFVGCASLSGLRDTAEVVVPRSKLTNTDNLSIQVMDITGNYYINSIPTNLHNLIPNCQISISEQENNRLTYLTLISGSTPKPNAVGLNPKNDEDEWRLPAEWIHGWNPVFVDNKTTNDKPILIEKVMFERGISVTPGDAADARLVYDLTAHKYTKFKGCIGLSDENDSLIRNFKPGVNDSCNAGGSVIFTFNIDGRTIYESGVLTGKDYPAKVDFDIPRDVQELEIIVSNADDLNRCDVAVIGGARLLSSPIDEEDEVDMEERDDLRVNPKQKLTTQWGQLKSRY